MDLRKVKKLIELVEESGISELEVKSGEEAVRIVRPTSQPAVSTGDNTPVERVNTEQPGTPVSTQKQLSKTAGFVVTAPLTGTFYRAPAPDEQPYVAPGQDVQIGDVLCIIESMKMMNYLEAEQAGRVTAVLVEDGSPIQEEQPLFTIE